MPSQVDVAGIGFHSAGSVTVYPYRVEVKVVVLGEGVAAIDRG